MKFKIGKYVLDVHARTLSDEQSSQNIRPKTLALLLYLAERNQQIISKQELLNSVWDDVTVDEGVIFQSVREVRNLFSNPDIVQNHPRKGYQFTSELLPITEEQQGEGSFTHHSSIKYLAAAVMLLSLFTILILQFNTEETAGYEQSVMVLPIKNQVPYGSNDWVYLGGMEQLIADLKNTTSSRFVYQGSHVLDVMNQVGLERNFQSKDIAKVLATSGASLVVEAELHGNVYDYKLIYKLHTANDVKQGVILNTSVTDALTELANYIETPSLLGDQASQEFSQALLSEAMISYESDWHTSVSFFESYLALNPESVLAKVYLSKLYLWQEQIEQASLLLDKVDSLEHASAQEVAQVQLLRARIAVKHKQWPLAMSLFSEAESQIHTDLFLTANIAEEKGLAYIQQCSLEQAVEAFSVALSQYQTTGSLIGINTALLHKAYVLHLQSNENEALELFQKAKENITRMKLAFLYSMMSDYETQLSHPNTGICL